jgi:histidine triad (HIT) family protein
MGHHASSTHDPPDRFTAYDSSVSSEDCLFCGIAAGDVDADVVLSTDHVVAFRDVNAQAPTHVLVIPREHAANAAASVAADPEVAARLIEAAGTVAEQEGLESYRLVLNTGADAGQSVFHTHLHVLGGRSLQWPPG